MLNNYSQSPKVCTNNQKSPNPCQCWDVGGFWGLGEAFSNGNCKGVKSRKFSAMKKTPAKSFSKVRCSTKNILAQVSLNEKTIHLFLIHYRQRHLTRCLEILESAGYSGDTAIFMLSWLGGAS